MVVVVRAEHRGVSDFYLFFHKISTSTLNFLSDAWPAPRPPENSRTYKSLGSPASPPNVREIFNFLKNIYQNFVNF